MQQISSQMNLFLGLIPFPPKNLIQRIHEYDYQQSLQERLFQIFPLNTDLY